MLMAQINESFDNFLARTVRRLVLRLLVIDGELGGQPAQDDAPDLLAELRMAVRLRNAVDEHIRFMVVACATNKAETLLDQMLSPPSPRLTWKELGEALGVSAQAAHRKYGAAAREYEASGRTTPLVSLRVREALDVRPLAGQPTLDADWPSALQAQCLGRVMVGIAQVSEGAIQLAG
jgi:hypothetical protein